jgi:hypothetical protein
MVRAVVAMALACTSLTALAEEQKYTIQLKAHPEEGRVVDVRFEDEMKGVSKRFDANGRLISEDEPSSRKLAYTCTVLKAGRGEAPPERLMRVYDQATANSKNDCRKLPFHDRTLILERKGGEYRIADVCDKPLTRLDLAELFEELNCSTRTDSDRKFAKLLTPPAKVAVGESWKLDFADLKSYLQGIECDRERTQARATLKKVYRKDGRDYGVIEISVRGWVSKIDGDTPILFADAAKLELTHRFDGAIDGGSIAKTESGRMAFQGKGVTLKDGEKTLLDLDFEVNFRSECGAERKPNKPIVIPAKLDFISGVE